MIEVRQLRYFCMLAETLNFRRAAERLNLSQPPLSRQIAVLEKELGVALFSRTTRTVTLTGAGQRFYIDAKSIIAALEQAAKNAAAAGRGEEGALSVGFTSCAAYSVVPMLARAYSATFPKVTFKIRELLSDDLTNYLLAGKIDAAIMFPPEPHIGLNTKQIYKEPICVAVTADHPLASVNQLRIENLASEPFVIPPRAAAPAFYDTIISYCHAAGFEPTIRLQAHLQQTILNLVAEGVGIALVPQSMTKMLLAGVTFKALPTAPFVHQVIAWTASNHNPCLSALLEMDLAR